MQLVTNKQTSPASRKLLRLQIKWLNLIKIPKLSSKLKPKYGRSVQGKILVFSKGFRKKSNNYLNLVNLRLNSNLGFIISNTISFINNKIYDLVLLSNGLIFYKISTQFSTIFSFFFLDKSFWLNPYWLDTNLYFLIQLNKLDRISSLELIPGKGIQYVKAPGSSGRIITFNYNLHKALILLPSGLKKFISFYSLAFKGQVANKRSKEFGQNKAGYWKVRGFKSKVRGVAKNPIDHPHGGRTKSIRYPRTPWGKTAKLK